MTVAGAGAGSAAVMAARHATPLAPPSSGLDVLPFPGTEDAPPGTPIIFPEVPPAQISAVNAVGSRTGVHAGRLSAQPDNSGSHFAPTRPFAVGERVSVAALLRSSHAAEASGAPGTKTLRFSFSIERPAAVPGQAGALPSGSGSSAASPDTLGMTPATERLTHASSSTTHAFVTQPYFHPPIVTMSGRDTDHSSGDVFLDAQNTGQNAPYVLTANADLRWYHPTAGPGSGKGPAAFDVRVQMYRRHPYLTYWEGHLNFGVGNGVGLMLGEHYRRAHTVTAGAGYERDGVDLHEFSIGPHGDAFVTVYAPVHANLTSVGGSANGTVFDCIAQEINISTNRVLWEWNALNHVPVNASYAPYVPGQPFDYFHMNSIQELSNGHVVISARNTWAVYDVTKSTGKINWVLGGRHPTFFMGSGTHFYWQHDAVLHRHGLLTVYDDGAGDGIFNEHQSRGIAIHLNTKARHASLRHEYLHSPSVLTQSMGSTQLLGNGNVFVGWGAAPTYSEYTTGGSQIFSASFRSPVDSYRAYRSSEFKGEPLSRPAIAVRRSSLSGSDNVYVSWNGSTEVTRWRLRAGKSRKHLASIKKVRWSAFETTIKVRRASYFQVQALGSKSRVLPHGTSRIVAGR
ncbi:MAG: aryl-sulfate sulfotransferase [Solirubrobacterales bacterium]|nr:aryl-sulfate sulfotransferase [Solirubrobacterales bacterium]